MSLVIAEYQCNVEHLGQQQAQMIFLPLASDNWITNGNALRLDWLQVGPPEGSGVRLHADDLFGTLLDQPAIDFDNEGGETIICGNPPYAGDNKQTKEQKADLSTVFSHTTKLWKSLDYVGGWFMKAADYASRTRTAVALVSTNSICQGNQVSIIWPLIYAKHQRIFFAHTSFKWANLAKHNAGVTVVIVGISSDTSKPRILFSSGADGDTTVKRVGNINAYLVPGQDIYVKPRSKANPQVSEMQFGNHPYYGTALLLGRKEERQILAADPKAVRYIRPLYGSKEFISSNPRACIWIEDDQADEASTMNSIALRIVKVKSSRLTGGTATKKKKADKAALKLMETPHRFRDQYTASRHTIIVPGISSENRPYLPVGILRPECIVHYKAFAMYDAPLWNIALIASRMHWVWIGTVCVRMRTDFSYSNTLGWNTFPIETLTDQNKVDLARCAEEILLAREAHFPATIADLYQSETDDWRMPENLRAAHEANDEVLERIYIGRRFRNDTERLEKLFDMYTKMTSTSATSTKPAKRAKKVTA